MSRLRSKQLNQIHSKSKCFPFDTFKWHYLALCFEVNFYAIKIGKKKYWFSLD